MKSLLSLLLVSALCGLAAAQAPSTGTLRLPDILKEAAERNPEIAAAREHWLASSADASMQGWPDKPRLSIERMFVPRGAGLSRAEEKNLAISQDFAFPTTLYYRRRAERRRSDAIYQEYRAKRLQISARVRSAYAMLFLTDRSLALLDEAIELMRGVARTADGRYAAGKAGQGESLKASLELSRMLYQRISAQKEMSAAAAMLIALLDRAPGSELGRPEEPPLDRLRADLEQTLGRSQRGRPELLAAASRREQAQAEVALARSLFLPDISLMYRRRESPVAALDGTWDASLGLSLPLWFGSQSAGLRHARYERSVAEAELRSMRAMTAAETTAAYARSEAALQLAESYRTSLLPQARQSLEVAQAAYRSDKGSFLDLLDSQRSLLDSQREYYEAVAEAQLRTAELGRLAGDEEEAP